jgi:hypothetical protein
MMSREIIAVYPMKPTNTLCGQNAEFLYVKAGGTRISHVALKGYAINGQHSVQNQFKYSTVRREVTCVCAKLEELIIAFKDLMFSQW